MELKSSRQIWRSSGENFPRKKKRQEIGEKRWQNKMSWIERKIPNTGNSRKWDKRREGDDQRKNSINFPELKDMCFQNNFCIKGIQNYTTLM